MSRAVTTRIKPCDSRRNTTNDNRPSRVWPKACRVSDEFA
jgi:hypothetical protein